MRRINILLVEDNRILRDGIKGVINKEEDLRVVAATGGNHDTLKQARRFKPQVVLIDLGLRGENSLSLLETLTRELPQTEVIGMGLIPSKQDIIEFVQAGAAGFILKDAPIEDVLETIRAVAQGMRVLPPVLIGSLFTHVAELVLRNGKRKLRNAARMTKREREIVALIADGLSNKEIARRLFIAIHTAKSHVHNILEKLALQSRLQISAFAHNEEPP